PARRVPYQPFVPRVTKQEVLSVPVYETFCIPQVGTVEGFLSRCIPRLCFRSWCIKLPCTGERFLYGRLAISFTVAEMLRIPLLAVEPGLTKETVYTCSIRSTVKGEQITERLVCFAL